MESTAFCPPGGTRPGGKVIHLTDSKEVKVTWIAVLEGVSEVQEQGKCRCRPPSSASFHPPEVFEDATEDSPAPVRQHIGEPPSECAAMVLSTACGSVTGG
jgi:hypothetical protein